jgi:predicted SAM-dependent methyltransferase
LANCINTDILELCDVMGRRSVAGTLAKVDSSLYYLQHDARHPFPFRDERFNWIFAEHFIEHLKPQQALPWLREMRRLLRPGGVMRLSTPDLERYVNGYIQADQSFFQEHAQRLRRIGIQVATPRRAWMMNQIFLRWGHRWIYDFNELCLIGRQAGFTVQRLGFHESALPELSQLDLPIRNDESIYVELQHSGSPRVHLGGVSPST